MKETIKFYYNVYIEKLYTTDMGSYFYMSGFKYYFLEFNRDIKEIDILVKMSNDLYNKGILVDTFILTKDNKYFVYVEDKIYVMLRVNSIEEDKYNLKDIVYFNNLLIVKNENLLNNNWATLWMKKVDDFEEEISELNTDYPLIQNTFDYYMGLAENAISYVNDTFIDEKPSDFKVNLNHKRIKEAYQGYVNNPLTFTFDYSVRDIAEYVKYKFFNNTLEIDELEDLIFNYNFTRGELRLLYARLLYPSYYLDTIKDIFILDKDESVLKKYINKQEEYEYFLKDIYHTIKKKIEIPPVEWLVNKN